MRPRPAVDDPDLGTVMTAGPLVRVHARHETGA
jgi:hypothetical protein